ncbi:succinate dehydrogenase, cytochrome b556 subunit [Aestuariivirga sp.]|uniref:succinate dehydrogenase, cytochrome b556 subunit n=1 Tax=Aestuariivirga sp. TaxID=2650926 RepID=UPI0025C4B8B7|nr:succinate dehydrogenase, cytochrome b556 subunit [Aestuariivirga sp.]MCA3554916.1 succinate dehydrogenase, cytochrome b556 subunit [Aestuariivirga sp.]
MADTRNARRPLSPHLQIYRGGLTMLMSIAHRITGVALYAGTLLLVWWLTAAATSDPYFDMVQAVFASVPGRLVLFGFTWALIHHTLGGIRHLIWDMGRGFGLRHVEMGARLSLAGSIILTLAVWAIGLGVS